MNAERLLQHYEQIADAPDAIARLRRFILDLAVRGKLVPQNPNDEPASELLKRIVKEKARRVKAGEIRSPKAIPVLSETPFAIPSNWRWSQLAEIGVLSPRNEAPESLDASFVPMSLIAAEYGGANQHEIRPWGEIKKGYTHFAEGDVGLAKITPCFENGKSAVFRNLTGGIGAGTTELHIVRPMFVDQDYILLFLKSPHFIGTGIPKMTGTAGQKRVPTEYFAYSPFPLPPLAEQHRIVAKVDKLIALCDRLEAARGSREAVRDRLAAASLSRLNAPAPETSQDDARFVLNALPALTTRPDQIKQLRQTILNLAVRGKLVPQDPNDEPASELLKRIAEEKVRLVKAGTIPAKKEPVRDPTKLTGELPASWCPIALGQVCNLVTSGSRGWAEFYAPSGPGFIRAQNIRFGKLRLDDLAFVTPPSNSEGSRTQVAEGDLLIVITGAGVTNPALLDHDPGESYVSQHVGLVRPSDRRCSKWLLLCLMADVGGRAELVERAYGAGKPGLNLDNIRSLSIPLPPLAEQHRIVAKVDALMALCDRLEASLSASAVTRRRLLDALLADALSPDIEQFTERPVVEPVLQLALAASGGADVRELTAMVLAFAYECHRQARRDKTFGHVKAQKILHLVESETALDLGRSPVKDAAGPNDFQHMLAAEDWALKNRHFKVDKSGNGYNYQRLDRFRLLTQAVNQIEAETRTRLTRIIDLFVPMDMTQAEIFATVYAAWNNLLIEGKTPTDDEIIRASREDWHPNKLKIPREQFLKALKHLKGTDFIPKGRGRLVRDAAQTRLL